MRTRRQSSPCRQHRSQSCEASSQNSRRHGDSWMPWRPASPYERSVSAAGSPSVLCCCAVRERPMKSLFVGNRNFQTSEGELRALFEPFGAVTRVHMAMDRETGRARGFAFIEMPNDEEAAKAIAGLDGTMSGGRELKVNEARPRGEGGGPPRGGNRGGGFGGGGNRGGGGGYGGGNQG